MPPVESVKLNKPIHILGAGLSGLSAAIVLARSGCEVHVHEIRADSGARFDGDFQGIENWTRPVDFLTEMKQWGIDPGNFMATPFREIDLVAPDGRISVARTPATAFWLVERGTGERTIDQGLKRQALAAGVRLHYRSTRPREQCDVVATGPRGVTGIVRGELFRTSHPDRVVVQLDDRLAPGAYTYMIVTGGVGLIATVLLRRQRDADRFLDESLAWYHAHYPRLDRDPIRRLGGVGCFALGSRYRVGERLYVGEAAGLQDCLWGFGIRYAVTSGVLAARALLGGEDYEGELRRRLRPFQAASLANRWLLGRLGARGLSGLARVWMWDQERRGDGLPFLSRLYRPSWLHWLLFKTVAGRGLDRIPGPDDGTGARYLPMLPPERRDDWPLSEAGRAVSAARRQPAGKTGHPQEETWQTST